MSETRRLLFISNGHGEDAEASFIARAIMESGLPIEMSAVAMVGEGKAYHDAGVPIVGPTFTPPSNGFSYMDRKLLIQDVKAGLLGATLGQWRAIRRTAHDSDLVLGIGDEYCQLLAWSSGRRFISYIAPLSVQYEGYLNLDLMLLGAMRSARCVRVLTKDSATADYLRARGHAKVSFGGNPSVDFLEPSGIDLQVGPDQTVIGLLPGSRPPEAERNFVLQMRLVEKVLRRPAAESVRLAFRAALVPRLMEALPRLAAEEGWSLEGSLLHKGDGPQRAEIGVPGNAFADILDVSSFVVAMAGQASDQALALGKPSFMFAGDGPQFSWRFAEAQNRLHGGLSRLIGTGPADDELLETAAKELVTAAQDEAWLVRAREEGPRRMGSRGSAERFVDAIRHAMGL